MLSFSDVSFARVILETDKPGQNTLHVSIIPISDGKLLYIGGPLSIAARLPHGHPGRNHILPMQAAGAPRRRSEM